LQRRFQRRAGPDALNEVCLLDGGPFRVITYGTIRDEEHVVVEAFDEYLFWITTDPWRHEKALLLSIIRNDGEIFLSYGDKEGVFPGRMSLVPQSGPDAHVVLIHDGDMDGVFESRMVAPGVLPEEDMAE